MRGWVAMELNRCGTGDIGWVRGRGVVLVFKVMLQLNSCYITYDFILSA